MESGLSTVKQYFPHLSAAQEEKLEALPAVYAFWNERINVISKKDMDKLYIRHVLHSLAIAKFISLKPGSRLMDLGTGGGFPGIPLAIFFPETSFLLVDGVQKKIKVVHAAVRSLELHNVRTNAVRGETVTGEFDFIVSRAVAKADKLCRWCKGKVNAGSSHPVKNGLICLKGGDLTEELRRLNRHHRLVELSDYFPLDYFKTKKLLHIPL